MTAALELRDVWDPRDPWTRTRKIELLQYADKLGISEITEQMPHTLIVKRMKALGVPPPNTPARQLGASPGAEPVVRKSGENTVTVSAEDLAELEWRQQQHMAPPKIELGFNEMRAAL